MKSDQDFYTHSRTSILKRSFSKKYVDKTSLVVQWLRLHAPSVVGPGSIPGQGTISGMPQLKIPHNATKSEDPTYHN